MAREGVPLIVIQRQLGHTNLGITSIYLQGIDNTEIIDTVHARRAPMVPVDSSLAALTPRPAAGKPTTSAPPVLVQVARHEPGGGGSQNAHSSRSSDARGVGGCARPARRGTHAASRRATPGRRMQRSTSAWSAVSVLALRRRRVGRPTRDHSRVLRKRAETRCRVTPKRSAIWSIVRPSAYSARASARRTLAPLMSSAVEFSVSSCTISGPSLVETISAYGAPCERNAGAEQCAS